MAGSYEPRFEGRCWPVIDFRKRCRPFKRWTGAQIEREDLFATSGATPGETAPSVIDT